MKRIALVGLILVGGTVGCWGPFVHQPDKLPALAPPTPPPPITADGITDKNAQEKAQALRQELEREAQPPAPKAEEIKK
jgi:hypothetical protein